MNFLAHRGEHRIRIAGSAHGDIHQLSRLVRCGHVGGGIRLLIQRSVANVGSDSDNREFFSIADDAKDAPDGIVAAPKFLRRLLADDHHRRGASVIVIVKNSSADQGDFHRREVSGTHHAPIDGSSVPNGKFGIANGGDGCGGTLPDTERESAGYGDAADARERLHGIDHRFEEPPVLGCRDIWRKEQAET